MAAATRIDTNGTAARDTPDDPIEPRQHRNVKRDNTGAWGLAVAMVLAGRNLARRCGYTFCLVVAGIECAFMPFGTVLGVFTIVVLTKPAVKRLFETAGGGPLAENGGP